MRQGRLPVPTDIPVPVLLFEVPERFEPVLDFGLVDRFVCFLPVGIFHSLQHLLQDERNVLRRRLEIAPGYSLFYAFENAVREPDLTDAGPRFVCFAHSLRIRPYQK